jgi:hypothetical protein
MSSGIITTTLGSALAADTESAKKYRHAKANAPGRAISVPIRSFRERSTLPKTSVSFLSEEQRVNLGD